MKNAIKTMDNTLNRTSADVVIHHLQSFQNNDLEGVLADYTNASVLITAEETYNGPAEIKTFFARLMTYFPKKHPGFTLDKIVAEGDLVFIVWHASTPGLDVVFGTDTFLIKDGKIIQQTFAGQLSFK